jgi:Na+/serine symporter
MIGPLGVGKMTEGQLATRLVSESGGARKLFASLFGLWGGIGLLLMFVEVMATNSMASVGVGQSSYVIMHLMLYLAGTVFFGFCALISGVQYDFRRKEVPQSIVTDTETREHVAKWKNLSALNR